MSVLKAAISGTSHQRAEKHIAESLFDVFLICSYNQIIEKDLQNI